MSEEMWQPIGDAIRNGDIELVTRLVIDLDEADRKRVSKFARKAAESGGTGWNRGSDDPFRKRWEAMRVAEFGTAGPAAAEKVWRWGDGVGELRSRLVRARPPSWQQDYASRIMRTDEVDSEAWALVRGLVREGLIDAPDGIGYLAGAIQGFVTYRYADRSRAVVRPLADCLRDDPDWLRDELWRLFEIEDAGMTSRQQYITGDGDSWHQALVTLAADGTLDRDRLLDESLAVLRRDFSPYNARWFKKLFEELEPTIDEVEARLPVFLALLSSLDSAVVGHALKTLAALDKAKRLPADAFFDALAPVLALEAEGHVVRAIKLSARVLKRDKGCDRIALPILVEALAHESRDVQEAALAVIAPRNEALTVNDRTRLSDLAAAVDPAIRADVVALSGDNAPAAAPPLETTGPAVELPPRREVDRTAPRLADAALLEPVASVEDLLDRAAVALERGDDPDEIELVLDGISRFRDEPVDEGRATALVARADPYGVVWEGAIYFAAARTMVAVPLLRWLGDRMAKPHDSGHRSATPLYALTQRLYEFDADLVSGPPRPLLATPTHAGGWIDPLTAVDRVAALDDKPHPLDLAQMVLRLAPDNQAATLARAEQQSGEAADVLVYALGGDDRRRGVRHRILQRNAPAWSAAAYASGREEPTIADPLVGADQPYRWAFMQDFKVPKISNAVDLVNSDEVFWAWEEGGLDSYLLRVWPGNQEAVFRSGARRLAPGFDSRAYGLCDQLEVLLSPSEPIGAHAMALIGLSLGCSEAPARVLAVDVILAALQDRRLDGASLGRQLADLLRRQKFVTPSRWVAAMSDLAQAGPLWAHEAQAAIEAILAAAEKADSRRLIGLVDILRALSIKGDQAVTDERARLWLSGLSPKSKGGRAAREALAITGDGAARSQAALAQVS